MCDCGCDKANKETKDTANDPTNDKSTADNPHVTVIYKSGCHCHCHCCCHDCDEDCMCYKCHTWKWVTPWVPPTTYPITYPITWYTTCSGPMVTNTGSMATNTTTHFVVSI